MIRVVEQLLLGVLMGSYSGSVQLRGVRMPLLCTMRSGGRLKLD